MLALGSAIGGAFFLGSAIAIRSAGPAILLGFVLGGALVYVVLMSLAELTVRDPAPGSFHHYAGRAFGPLAGFVVGWVYWTGLTLAMSSEATAAAVFLRQWLPGLSATTLASLIVLAVTGLNLLGARQLARLEGTLAAVKLLAVAGFIAAAWALIAGLLPGRAPVGLGALAHEPLVAGGWRGLAGGMLIVLFTYAGTEIIGLAAPSTRDPRRTVPLAARRTALALTGLYVLAVGSLLPLIPTRRLDVNASPLVAGLSAHGIPWAARAINGVLVTAILSTMLAVMFSLGRVVRSLAEDGLGPAWLRERGEVPRRGILFSGLVMLLGVGLGYLVPRQVYVFLVSAGGYALILVYVSVVAARLRLRRDAGAAQAEPVLVPGHPVTSWLALAVLAGTLAGLPLVPGQASGLIAGLALTGLAAAAFTWQRRRAAGAPGEAGHAGRATVGEPSHGAVSPWGRPPARPLAARPRLRLADLETSRELAPPSSPRSPSPPAAGSGGEQEHGAGGLRRDALGAGRPAGAGPRGAPARAPDRGAGRVDGPRAPAATRQGTRGHAGQPVTQGRPPGARGDGGGAGRRRGK